MKNQDKIVMAALKLSKAHTRWKSKDEKGSVKSFSKAKGEFINDLRFELVEVFNAGQQSGWEQAFEAVKKANEKELTEVFND